MKLKLEQTTKLVHLDGVPARLWEGTTESGVKVHAFITRIAVHNEEDQDAFERELEERRAPSAKGKAWPLRMLL